MTQINWSGGGLSVGKSELVEVYIELVTIYQHLWLDANVAAILETHERVIWYIGTNIIKKFGVGMAK